MLVLAAHATGIGWDELAVMLGGLTAITGTLILFLRGREPEVLEAPEVAPQPAAPPRQPRRHR